MRIILDTDNTDLSHIKEVLEHCKEIGVVEGKLSTITYEYPKYKLMYTLWGNKKSIRVESREIA